MGIGPQNLGAQGMSSKSKPCGTPLKMAKDSPMAKALIGNQDRLPDQLKEKILAAPEDSPATKLEAGSITMKPDSDVEKYRKLDIKESE